MPSTLIRTIPAQVCCNHRVRLGDEPILAPDVLQKIGKANILVDSKMKDFQIYQSKTNAGLGI